MMRKDVFLMPGSSYSGNETDVLPCGKIDRASRKPAIVYIDDKSLTRECVGQQLAMVLPETAVVIAASVEDIPKEAIKASRFLVGILNKHAAPIGDPAFEAQLSRLADLAADLPRVVFSDIDDADDIVKAFALGVRGYISINSPIQHAVEAIRLVSAGGSYVPSSILSLSTQRSAAQSYTERKEHHCAERFSPRQMEVLQRLWQGKQNKTIAYDLHMCESTVKVHIRHIMKKLNARNRTQVVLLTRSLNENDGASIEWMERREMPRAVSLDTMPAEPNLLKPLRPAVTPGR
jgi:DNA-binding NarL/FixJ family response regulator